MDRPLTVLIVGGYGTFGGRLARLLGDLRELTLLIAGRSRARAEQFCASERANRPADGAACRAVRFDRDGDVAGQLRLLAPHIVVDASGPFQAYGDFGLVTACIECGVHYLDLADSAEFVCGVSRFDQRARERGVFVLSGVSSFPVLTAAAVRALAASMTRVETIAGGVAPSPFARVGLNVIRAIAGYAGRPVRVVSAAGERVAYPFTETLRYTIAIPGCVPLRPRTFSLVEVPDLRLFAGLWPECRSVWMGAAPEPALWHRLLRGLARLVRWRLLPSLSFLAPLMHWATNRLAWGEHRGGMFVHVTGFDAFGARVERSWHLIAEGDSGPFIPSMAAEAVIRRFIAARAPASGARPALRELDLADYEPLFARLGIRTGVREDIVAPVSASLDPPLYQRILGPAWHALPASVRSMHSVHTTLTARGHADVARGSRLLARWVASIVGFPASGNNIPVEVRFDVTASRERWTRRFATRTFSSDQFPGKGRWHALLCERFGPITLALAVIVENSRLRLIVRGWSLLGIPLPSTLAPHCDAYESEVNGRFHFDVAIAHRWIGSIVHYRGWLTVEC